MDLIRAANADVQSLDGTLTSSRERRLAYHREYHAAHKEEICAAKKAYQKTHREYFRTYYCHNKIKMLEYGRKYREAKKLLMT